MFVFSWKRCSNTGINGIKYTIAENKRTETTIKTKESTVSNWSILSWKKEFTHYMLVEGQLDSNYKYSIAHYRKPIFGYFEFPGQLLQGLLTFATFQQYGPCIPHVFLEKLHHRS